MACRADVCVCVQVLETSLRLRRGLSLLLGRRLRAARLTALQGMHMDALQVGLALHKAGEDLCEQQQ